MNVSGSAEATAMLHALAGLRDHEIDLGLTMLWLSKVQYPELDFDGYFGQLDDLAERLRDRFDDDDSVEARVEKLSEFMSEDCEFRGNSSDYYDPRNSFLTDVLERQVGIPISLACLYIEVAKRAGIRLAGVGFPYHFILKAVDAHDLFIDPFHSGTMMDSEGCEQLLAHITDGRLPFSPAYLQPVGRRETLVRVFRNLKNIYVRQEQFRAAVRMCDLILAWAPEEWLEYRDRGLMRLHRQEIVKGISDLQEYLAQVPDAPDHAEILGHLQEAHRKRREIN